MISSERTVQIDRPREEVFEFVSDPANDARYRKGAKSAEWSTLGPVRVGSEMRSVDFVLGREVETTSRITTWDPPTAYAFRTDQGSFPSRFTLEFESVDDGTELTARGKIEFKGLLSRVEWLLRRLITSHFERDLETLKLLFEAEGALTDAGSAPR